MRTILLIAALTTQQAWPTHERTAPPARPVALVNGVALMSDRLQSVLNALLPMESFHQQVSTEKVAELRRRALSQIIDEELQFQEGRTAGAVISSKEIDAAVADLARRYRDRDAFDAALRKSGATSDGVREEFRRKLTIAKAYDQHVGRRCTVSAAAAREYFTQHPERFREPERLHLRAITIGVDPSGGQQAWSSGRAKADAVRREIAAGRSFEDAARAYSTDPSAKDAGEMGLSHRGSLSPAFEAAAQTMRPGDVSDVLESIYGYHLIQLVEVLPARPRSFDDVGAALQQSLTSERCAAMASTWLADLRARASIEYPR